mgnify:CR=1 FL=1
MAKFQYRMQSILNIKLKMEEQAKMQFAQAQARLNEEEAKAKANTAIQEEAKGVALEADLIRMGADPESAKAFVNAKELGLDTKSFGMIRKKGKFVGSYSSLADKLSKDSLTDSLSSKVINEEGFAKRVIALGGTRKGRVEALVAASKGGKK